MWNRERALLTPGPQGSTGGLQGGRTVGSARAGSRPHPGESSPVGLGHWFSARATLPPRGHREMPRAMLCYTLGRGGWWQCFCS